MNFDIGRALLGALGGAGSAVEQMGLQQQKLQDAQQIAQMNEQAWEARQQFLADENGPKTRQETIADPNNPGSNIVQNEHWQPAEKGAPGVDPATLEPGQYLVDSTANDPKTEAIANHAENAAASLDLRSKQLDMQQQLGQARADAQLARIEAANARGTNGKLVRQVNPDGSAVYGTVSNGQFTPVTDQNGNPLSSTAWRQRQGPTNTIKLADESTLKARSADAIGPASPVDPYGDRPDVSQMPSTKTSPQVTFVDPSASGAPSGAPLSQLASTRTTIQPHPSSGGTSSVARTTPYPDGTSLVGPNGQRYVVHNGVPVPDGG